MRPSLALGALLAGYASGAGRLRRPPRRLPDDRADVRQPARADERDHAAALRADHGAARARGDRAVRRRARCGRPPGSRGRGSRAARPPRRSRPALVLRGGQGQPCRRSWRRCRAVPRCRTHPTRPARASCWACSSTRSDHFLDAKPTGKLGGPSASIEPLPGSARHLSCKRIETGGRLKGLNAGIGPDSPYAEVTDGNRRQFSGVCRGHPRSASPYLRVLQRHRRAAPRASLVHQGWLRAGGQGFPPR